MKDLIIYIKLNNLNEIIIERYGNRKFKDINLSPNIIEKVCKY